MTAQIRLNSDMSSLTGLEESIKNGEAVTDDVLSLIDSTPKFAKHLSDIGVTISDFNLDDMLDNVDGIQKAISRTKL